MQRKGLPEGAWVVVADGEKALILENVGDEVFPNLSLMRKDVQDNPADREQGTDRPGRMPDASQGQRSAMEETDWHRLAKDRFAQDLAELLNARAKAHDISALVLIAAPHVLGELRKHLHEEVAGRILGEIPKTLTKHTVADIEAQVQAALGG